MSKKKYLLLLILAILIVLFIVVNYKPLSLAIEYYNNLDVYEENSEYINLNYFIEKVENDIANNTYQQYMLDITDYYITSDFVYLVFDQLNLLDAYFKGVRSKMIEQYCFVSLIKYGIPSKDNEKITEMLKYYPIADMEKFPDLTCKFVEKLSHYASNTIIAILSCEFALYLSGPLCYIVVTRQGCNNKEYYYNKFMYDFLECTTSIFSNLIPIDTQAGIAAKQQHNDVVIGYYNVLETIYIQEINNACGL